MSKKGAMETLLWTQLSEAIKNDFGIALPRMAGKEITKVIRETVEEMLELLDKLEAKPK